MKKRLLGFYDYTVILTYLGLMFSCLGIARILGHCFFEGIVCLMLAGVCDMFDGTVAATKERSVEEKRFGIQIDSLCDLIGFGMLPASFAYELSEEDPAAGVVAALYVLCAVIRLAYFNVLEEKRQQEEAGQRSSYLGVPVTTVAVLLPAVYLLMDCANIRDARIIAFLLVVLGLGFLTPVEIRKPKTVGKAVLVVIGAFEAIGVLFLMIWGAV